VPHGEIEEPLEQYHLMAIGVALKAPEADVEMTLTHQHRRARRRGFIGAEELLAGLEQAERL
jgi:hypothetical protein